MKKCLMLLGFFILIVNVFFVQSASYPICEFECPDGYTSLDGKAIAGNWKTTGVIDTCGITHRCGKKIISDDSSTPSSLEASSAITMDAENTAFQVYSIKEDDTLDKEDVKVIMENYLEDKEASALSYYYNNNETSEEEIIEDCLVSTSSIILNLQNQIDALNKSLEEEKNKNSLISVELEEIKRLLFFEKVDENKSSTISRITGLFTGVFR